MAGHESLREQTGIIQSDISIGNLMMNEEVQPSIRGYGYMGSSISFQSALIGPSAVERKRVPPAIEEMPDICERPCIRNPLYLARKSAGNFVNLSLPSSAGPTESGDLHLEDRTFDLVTVCRGVAATVGPERRPAWPASIISSCGIGLSSFWSGAGRTSNSLEQ
jgi:hypothetical protein